MKKTNLTRNTLLALSCVLLTALGFTILSASSTTTIGLDISTGNLALTGNVTSGTWQGTAVATQYGGTGQNFNASTGILKLTDGTASMITDNSINWDTAYTYSQVGHLPLTGGTLAGGLTVDGVTGLVDSDIPDTITASSYLPLAGGTLTADLTIEEAGDAKLTIYSNTNSPTEDSKLLVVQKGIDPLELFSVDEDGDVVAAGDFAVSGGELYLTGVASSSSTTEGTMYYDTDDDQLKVYANDKWQSDRSTATIIVGTSNPSGASLNYEKADYVCSGTDDNVQIQAAIDALPSGGGKVVLMEGTYIAHSIKLHGTSGNKNNVELVGSGWSTIIKLPAMTRHNIIDIDGMSGCYIGNLQLDGNHANQDVENWCMKYGPSGEGGPNACVAGVCEIYLNNIRVTDSDRVTIENVYSHNAGHWGILFHTGTTRSMIKDCYVSNCLWHALGCWHGGHYSVISGCISKNNYKWGVAVELGFPSDMHISVVGCSSSDDGNNSNVGIGIQSCENVVVSGCVVNNQTMQIRAADYCTLSGNIIKSNGRGIGCYVTGDYNTIFGNTFSNILARDGIQIDDGGKYNTILANTVSTGTFPGIRIASGTYNKISNNIIKDITGGGALYETPGSDHNIMSDNSIYDCSNPLTTSGANTVVRNNVGFVTESSGTATLANGTTSIAVAHGLAVTPVAGDIMVTPIETLASASFAWIDTYTSSHFTIHVDADPTQDVDFAWKAVVL